jgi:hypothetical protein
MKYHFAVASDLYNAGRNEDGREYHAEVYYVIATDEAGARWSHHSRFKGCKVVATDDGPAFLDLREQAQAQVERLRARIELAGAIDLDYWREERPAYGSSAYVAYGAANDWEEEQRERVGLV